MLRIVDLSRNKCIDSKILIKDEDTWEIRKKLKLCHAS
jgi:hypothetical protein